MRSAVLKTEGYVREEARQIDSHAVANERYWDTRRPALALGA